jgi:hypothetical protein
MDRSTITSRLAERLRSESCPAVSATPRWYLPMMSLSSSALVGIELAFRTTASRWARNTRPWQRAIAQLSSKPCTHCGRIQKQSYPPIGLTHKASLDMFSIFTITVASNFLQYLRPNSVPAGASLPINAIILLQSSCDLHPNGSGPIICPHSCRLGCCA